MADSVSTTPRRRRFTCSICHKRVREVPHDARPLSDDPCCRDCTHDVGVEHIRIIMEKYPVETLWGGEFRDDAWRRRLREGKPLPDDDTYWTRRLAERRAAVAREMAAKE